MDKIGFLGIIFSFLPAAVLCQDCNFDNPSRPTCGWDLAASHSQNMYQWVLHNGSTPQPRTGPEGDYSHVQNGNYLYAPGGIAFGHGQFRQRNKKSKAHVTSSIIRTRWMGKIMRFYYFMNGRDIGALNVYVVVKGSKKKPKPQWRKTNDKGREWKMGEVRIPKNRTSRVIFEAVPGRGPAGDIAIDEITFRDLAVDCTFEGERRPPSCQFTQSIEDDFDWQQNSGKTQTKRTGPSTDQTKGTSKGVYMYIEATERNENETAALITTRFQKQVAPCTLSFFYHMQGNGIGALKVHVITEPGEFNEAVWQQNVGSGNFWLEATVNLTMVEGPYEIAFVGVRGENPNGDIAIDDIKLLGLGCLNRDVIPALENNDTIWDHCENNDCQNNSTCVNEAGDYECQCTDGWTGQFCDEEMPEGPCRSYPCRYDGTCIQGGSNGTYNYTCICAEDRAGENCSIDLSEHPCYNSPCDNNGTCISDDSQDLGYTCNCTAGWGGSNCNRDMYCQSETCMNGGTCLRLPDGFNCTCTNGWNGTNCETDIDECALEDPCENESTCTNTPGAYNCTCRNPWYGERCQLTCGDDNKHCRFWAGMNECDANPRYMLEYCRLSCGVCQEYVCEDNHFECERWADIGECKRNPFYMLANCHLSCGVCINDQCRTKPCLNNGTCTDLEDAYRCSCAAGFTGSDCEIDIDECLILPCKNNGNCTDRVNGYECACTRNFEGPTCEKKKDHCSSQPCMHGGNCSSGENEYNCTCLPGFEGENCETDVDECASSPCLNGGSCIDQANSYLCNCTQAWVGVLCEADFDECNSNPCQNGGTCFHGIGDAFFYCGCTEGYTGETCSTVIDECASSPCAHNATCISHLGYYNCTCPDGWTGSNCDVDILVCASNPCQHGGRCIEKTGGYKCLCLEQFAGANCEKIFDRCKENPCLNGGSCISNISSQLCDCVQHFTGRYCEEAPPGESGGSSFSGIDSGTWPSVFESYFSEGTQKELTTLIGPVEPTSPKVRNTSKITAEPSPSPSAKTTTKSITTTPLLPTTTPPKITSILTTTNFASTKTSSVLLRTTKSTTSAETTTMRQKTTSATTSLSPTTTTAPTTLSPTSKSATTILPPTAAITTLPPTTATATLPPTPTTASTTLSPTTTTATTTLSQATTTATTTLSPTTTTATTTLSQATTIATTTLSPTTTTVTTLAPTTIKSPTTTQPSPSSTTRRILETTEKPLTKPVKLTSQTNNLPGMKTKPSVTDSKRDNIIKNGSPRPNKTESNSIYLVALIAGGIGVVLFVIIIAIVIYRSLRSKRTRVYEQFDMDSKEECTVQEMMSAEDYNDPTESKSFKYSPM